MKALVGNFRFISLMTVILLFGCKKEDPPALESTLTIKSISVQPQVIALNGRAQISCVVDFNGIDNIKDIDFSWYCPNGTFESHSSQSTVWYPKAGEIGTFSISLSISHNNQTTEAKTFVKVVKTPADGWGSISGYLYDSKGLAIANQEVTSVTGETAKSNSSGFFLISDVPKGISSINFPGLSFSWVSDFSPTFEVLSGSHVHLGNVILYQSSPPSMLSATSMPGRRIYLEWNVIDPTLYQFIDIYQSTNKVKRLASSESSVILISSNTGYASFTSKAIPINGQISAISNSISGSYVNSIDPDPAYSSFAYSSFYNATLNWKGIDFENYLNGYRISVLSSYYWNFLSGLLSINTHSYSISTYPGMNGTYYIISIADDGSYNNSQPSSQRINLNVPSLEIPANFTGSYNGTSSSITLTWDKIALNPAWYSGYIINRASGTSPTDAAYKRIMTTSNVTASSFTNNSIALHTQYNYRLYSFSVRPGTTDTTFSNFASKVIIVP